MFSSDDMVYTYTRKQAIADGVQVALSEQFPEACTTFKPPVFCTAKIWKLIESAVNNPETLNDFNGVIKDICFMAAHSPGRTPIMGGAGMAFTVIVTGSSITPDFYEDMNPIYRLHAVCSSMDFDDPRPAITISFPDED